MITYFILIVGSSRKRKNQPEILKKMKKEAKKQRVQGESSTNIICKKCNLPGHSSARSPLCSFYIMNKAKTMLQNLGPDYTVYVRKLPFQNCVKEEYQNILKQKIISCCSAVREIVLRVKLFVNWYLLKTPTESAPEGIFRQQFWYPVCQMVGNRKPTNTKLLPEIFLQEWDNFKAGNPDVTFNGDLIGGSSQCITEACKELATTYENPVVEIFEDILKRFLRYRIQTMIVVKINK